MRGLCRSVPIPSPQKLLNSFGPLSICSPQVGFQQTRTSWKTFGQMCRFFFLLFFFFRVSSHLASTETAWMVNSVIGYIPVFCLKALFLEEIQAHVAVAIPSSSSSPSLLRFFFHRSERPKCCSTSIYSFYSFSVFIFSTTMECYCWCERQDSQHNMHFHLLWAESLFGSSNVHFKTYLPLPWYRCCIL